MRSLGAPSVVGFDISLLQSTPPRPPPPPPVARCNARTCPWWPYSDSKDFRTNAALILIILFSLLFCILAFLSAIRYLLLRHHSRHNQAAGVLGPQQLSAIKEEVPTDTVGEGHPSVQAYSKGMKLAGMERECAICLSEFVEGDGIKVLGRCDHGFHVQCIQQWLNSHSTCPTCRSNCLLLSSYSTTSSAPDSITPVFP